MITAAIGGIVVVGERDRCDQTIPGNKRDPHADAKDEAEARARQRTRFVCGTRAHFRDTGGVPLGSGAHFDHAACPYSVAQAGHTFGLGAMLAAEKCAFLFEPVTDDMNTAISAGRSERMDSALKAIEGVGPAVHAHLKRFVVVISACFALGHDCRHSVGE